MKVFKHPFKPVDKTSVDLDKLVKDVKKIMEMSDEEIVSLILDKATFQLCGCPNCHGGAQETSLTVWSIDDPWHIRCRYCGMRFPNEKYPEDRELKVVNPLGKVQTYRYYLDEYGFMYFFTDTARHRIKWFFSNGAYKLGLLYQLTGDGKYARKAAVILNRFAEVYPNIPVHSDDVMNRTGWKRFYTGPPPYPSNSGKWERWHIAELPTDCALAYDMIRESEELDKLSEELGYDVRKKIEDDFFRASVEFIKTYGDDPLPYRTIFGMIVIGRAIEEPEYVHEAVDSFKRFFIKKFFYDGMLELGSPGYHMQLLKGLERVPPVAEGYSDPPGYVSPIDKKTYKNLDLASEVKPFIERANSAVRKLLYPDGTFAPVHDAWPKSRYGLEPSEKPPEEAKPALLPGYGHAVLGRGKGPNQIQAHLHFCFLEGHGHADNLNIIIFAKGKELLPDIGYTHTVLRAWATCTLGHNTVLIDEKCQHLRNDKHSFGSLLLYDVSKPDIQVVEACGERSYDLIIKDLEMYRRLLLMIGVSEEDAYIVDIFRVKGGSLHDWVAHGSADEDQEVLCSLKLKPKPGTLRGPDTKYSDTRKEQDLIFEDRDSDYGLVDNLRSAVTKETWTCDWKCKDGSGVGLRVTMLGGPEREVILGQGPSVRAIKEENRLADLYKTSVLVVREKAKESVNVAIWEPYKGVHFIDGVEPLQVEGGDPMSVGVKVNVGERVDYILSTVDEPPFKPRVFYADGERIEMKGRLAVISKVKGKVRSAYLLNGTLIKIGDVTVESKGPITGQITAVDRSEGKFSFRTCTPLPTDGSLNGRTIIVRHGDGSTHGYTIKTVKRDGDESIIYTEEDPGFEITLKNVGLAGIEVNVPVTRFIYFPELTIEGENTFMIPISEYVEFT